MKTKKPNTAVVRQNAVLRYFLGNEKAMNIVLNKPYEYYAQNSTEDIIEMIEDEMKGECKNDIT